MTPQEIDNWLRGALSFSGQAVCRYVSMAAKKAGITKKELKESRHRIGVRLITQKDEEYGTKTYVWALPEDKNA